jgi:hypothetical protein
MVYHYQPSFKDKNLWKEFYREWHMIVASKIELVFEEQFTNFQLKYTQYQYYLKLLQYIKDIWLDGYCYNCRPHASNYALEPRKAGSRITTSLSNDNTIVRVL